MSKSIPASKTAQPADEATRGQKLRGALVLAAAAVTLVAGTYYVVLSLTGPDGFVTHMASRASADVEGRTLFVASDY